MQRLRPLLFSRRSFASQAPVIIRRSGTLSGRFESGSSDCKSVAKSWTAYLHSVWGFLVGASVTGGCAYVYLLDSYHGANEALVASMGQLQGSVEVVKKSLSKVDILEDELAQLRQDSATKFNLERRRTELLKAIVG